MSEQRFARIQIGDTHLTSDGSAEGKPCKAQVENEAAFASGFAARSRASADGTVWTQVIDRDVRGIEFALRIDYLKEETLALVTDELNAALAGSGEVRVAVESLTDLDVYCVPQMQNGALYIWEARSGGIVKGVTFRFISTGAFIEEEE